MFKQFMFQAAFWHPFVDLPADRQSEAKERKRDKWFEELDKYADNWDTKFHTYQEPGGTNYKELFVTAPTSESASPFRVTKMGTGRNRGGDWWVLNTSDNTYAGALSGSLTEQEALDFAKKTYKSNVGWKDGHPQYSGIQNPIVRLRFNDRTGPKGEKILYLEEVQPPSAEKQKKMPAELIKRWREIGMKRAIKYAVDNGYDKVAWTPGKIQTERYRLSKQVDSLQYVKSENGNYAIKAQPKGSSDLELLGHYKPEELEGIVGKGVAEQIKAGAGDSIKFSNYKTLSGLDLDVGGEGLAKIYNQDLPNVAKKLGAKINPVEMPNKLEVKKYPGYKPGGNWYIDGINDPSITNRYSSLAAATDALKNLRGNKVAAQGPSIDIAPLREKAKSGFPIYSILPVAGAAGLSALQAEKIRNKVSQ